MKPKTLQSNPESVKTDIKDNSAAPVAAAATASAIIQVELAGLSRRLVCMLYESLLILGILSVTVMLPWLAIGMVWKWDPSIWLGRLAWLHIFAVLGAYFVWFWRDRGQTLAMRTWRLKIVTADGSRLSTRHACLRYALACLSVLLCGAGIVWAVFDLDKLFLHDRLAKTRIVLLPSGRR